MRILDISPVISPRLDVWPGDVPFALKKSLDINTGAHLDLGAMTSTLHVGAHADAPRHYIRGGADAAEMPLDAFFGPAEVVRVQVARGERIRVEHLEHPVAASRVLLKTKTFPDPEAWNTDFAALSVELVDHLHEQGVVLIGIDTPSMDLFDDKELIAHKRLAQHGMLNLEGLLLDKVRPGIYTLAAFPLRIKDADASPVRAVLIEGEG
jgi:arylformamidase